MKENYIFGIRAVIEAINADKKVDKIVVRKGLNGDLFKELQELCQKRHVRMQFAQPEVLDRITTNNHQGVVAFLSDVEYISLDEIEAIAKSRGEEPFVVVLDGITDVRNLGAIARSADCAGVHAIIVPEKGSAPINGESIKTSAGALHYLPVCLTQKTFFAVKTLKDRGYKIVGATEHGADDYHKVDFRGPVAVVMGSEDKGISNQLLKLCDQNAKIDMYGHIESLNVSVAAGIILFEVANQRHAK
ncbi:MAG: 23S rRNA (guanosine(2251)-2'-O)-methyltransferase RlmB [Bacteroidales bacterium]|nr:23S rRNA (guanosine(2251)-2'-O)-methyltransferase RlmB [Bacteroidales bacterium]